MALYSYHIDITHLFLCECGTVEQFWGSVLEQSVQAEWFNVADDATDIPRQDIFAHHRAEIAVTVARLYDPTAKGMLEAAWLVGGASCVITTDGGSINRCVDFAKSAGHIVDQIGA